MSESYKRQDVKILTNQEKRKTETQKKKKDAKKRETKTGTRLLTLFVTYPNLEKTKFFFFFQKIQLVTLEVYKFAFQLSFYCQP